MRFFAVSLLCLFTSKTFGASEALVELGERLFNETRFSYSFWKGSDGNPNDVGNHQERRLADMIVPSGTVASPFRGQSTSCASCHMVDQAFSIDEAGMRLYTDFSSRVEIPHRAQTSETDEYVRQFAARNTPALVGIGSDFNRNRISHMDGEFSDHAQTVFGNFAGRNMGWLPKEAAIAKQNVLNVIRLDDGKGELAQEFGGSYRNVFLALEGKERLDVLKSSDEEVFSAVEKAVSAYMNDLDFQKNADGEYNGSPFDRFLLKNNFSSVPSQGENNENFTQRLRQFLANLVAPKFVDFQEFETHKKEFGFGPRELEGAKVFFNLDERKGKRGSCFKCHSAPLYTDQSFHNIGTSQLEYDGIHGSGSFQKIPVPVAKDRGELYFNQAPVAGNPHKFDLGMWNHYERNEELTAFFKTEFCSQSSECPLSMTLARFKTAGLRNLQHSNPYFHNGKQSTLKEVLAHYHRVSAMARKGLIRNADPILKEISIDKEGIFSLELFLRALNEDYD